jgi:hypothetical protein
MNTTITATNNESRYTMNHMRDESNLQALLATSPNKSARPWKIPNSPRVPHPVRKVKYSVGEMRLLRLLPEGGERISSTALIRAIYPSGGEPFYARSSVVSTMRILMRKIAINDEPFAVFQSAQAGPVPSDYWIEHRTYRAAVLA